jgi:phosphohistidine phosphatase
MKKLYLVRHSIAESFSPTGQDAGRRLSAAGIERARRMVAHLKSFHVSPSAIVASPYERAQQTASLLAEGLGFEESIEKDRRLIPTGNVRDVAALIQEFRELDELMLVGHEPWMSSAAALLLTNGRLDIYFSPGSVCCVGIERLTPAGGAMLWFLSGEMAD